MKSKLLFAICLLTVTFCVAIGFDITPYLRGPAPYPPDWRWEYYFVNTFSKIWLPLVIIFIICLLWRKSSLFIKKKREKQLLILLVVLSFLFQLAVLYYSRSGVTVLLHRIINPDMNGYFTAAVSLRDIPRFLAGFNEAVLQLPMHAQGHPPGAILFFWVINKAVSFFPVIESFTQNLTPTHQDVGIIWNTLLPYQRFSAILSGLLIPFLSTMVLIPLYYLGRRLYNEEIAIRAVFLYIFIPSLVLFIPINDVFLPLFTISSFYLFFRGLYANNKYSLFIAGSIFSLGLFFSLSLLPILLLFFIFFILYFLKQKKLIVQRFTIDGTVFASGLLILPILFFALFTFNFVEVSKTLMSGLPQSRQYGVWVFYNLYDFFIFSGIPILSMYCIMFWNTIKTIKAPIIKNMDHLFVAFTFMLFLLNFSGFVRGEVARIWIPFMPFLVLIVSNFSRTILRFSKDKFLLILVLQAIQILAMQEFWVTLW